MLINPSYKSYDYNSRYTSSPYYYDTVDNKYIYGRTEWTSSKSDYLVYITQEGDTLEKIALDYYGNPTLWWMIADNNRITDAFLYLPVNVEIKIPILATLKYEGDE